MAVPRLTKQVDSRNKYKSVDYCNEISQANTKRANILVMGLNVSNAVNIEMIPKCTGRNESTKNSMVLSFW